MKETILIGDLLEAPQTVRRKMCQRVLACLRKDDLQGAKALLKEWWKDGEGQQSEVA